MLFVKTLLGFLYATRSSIGQQQQQETMMDVDETHAEPQTAKSFAELLQQGLAPVLAEMFKASTSELEKHITAVEIAAAAAAAASKWDDENARNVLWEILCPLMVIYCML
ncbi:hypothetical protein cyc_06493 [Cyclospora cayetanensis]|uniref:Uncharacterized protein n=1 Tax=Cyclospora cayetanensis TaxID=88456 RepID=A0A1D3D1X3_9EIME|nr:hypothetical protein cyc_06493 [Cyclospora cayetanensis]